MVICFLVSLIMLLIRQIRLFNFKKEKYSFECGFENYKLNRLPFSLNFFIIRLIFVLFDLEIVILVAMIPYTVRFFLNPYLISEFFLIFILIRLLIE